MKNRGKVISYVYIHNRTEVRTTENQKQLSILAIVSRDQEYATEDIYAEGADTSVSEDGAPRKPKIRAGFPHFQGVEGVRATMSPAYITAVDKARPVRKKRSTFLRSVRKLKKDAIAAITKPAKKK